MTTRPLPIRPPRPINLRQQRWIEIREDGSGRLLFKYNPQHRLVEVQRRRKRTLVNLAELDGDAEN